MLKSRCGNPLDPRRIDQMQQCRIAETQLAPAINLADGAELWSVYSRDQGRAEARNIVDATLGLGVRPPPVGSGEISRSTREADPAAEAEP